MFPVVPNDRRDDAASNVPENRPQNVPTDRPVDEPRDPWTQPQDVSPARTEDVPVNDPAHSQYRTPTAAGNYKVPESDTFVVPKPAPTKPVEPAAPEPATEETFTHYVHLADGRVLKADLSNLTEHIGDRYYENRGEDNEFSTQIIGVYAR